MRVHDNPNSDMKKTNDLVYISGPMSSVQREQYVARFKLAEKILRSQGYTRIVNPVNVWTCRFPWLFRVVGYKLTLFYDLWMLTRCQRIYKMPGWRQSRGANIESCVAYHFGVFGLAMPARELVDKAIEKLIKKQAEELPPPPKPQTNDKEK